jgi:hypothetical protein
MVKQQHWTLFQIVVERFDERRRQEYDPIVTGLAASDNRAFCRQVQVISFDVIESHPQQERLVSKVNLVPGRFFNFVFLIAFLNRRR